jgi:hypothetical protein
MKTGKDGFHSLAILIDRLFNEEQTLDTTSTQFSYLNFSRQD